MQKVRLSSKPGLGARDARNGPGGAGSNGGHGSGSGSGHHGEGGGGGHANGGGDDNTSTAVTSTQKATTSAAIAATTAESSSAVQTSAPAKSPEVTTTAAARSSDSTAHTTAPAGSEGTGASNTSSLNESTTVESGATASQTRSTDLISTTATKGYPETSAAAVSAPAATSFASPSSSSSSSGSSSDYHSGSHAGVIAGVIVGLFALVAIGFIVYRFRRTRPLQRILGPLHKDRDMQTGPYQNMEKSDVGLAPNMTGETLVGMNTMRVTRPTKPLPKHGIGTGPPSAGNHLTLDTEYLGPAAARSVSPVSTVSELAPEVSPISPASTRLNMLPIQKPTIKSNAPETQRAVSMAGSEARIVSIPPRSSRTLTAGFPPGPCQEGRPRGPSRDQISRRPPGYSRNLTGGAGGGGAWMPARQETLGSAEFRPPPLSINRSKQTPLWAQNAPRPAGDIGNAGYIPYHPSMARQLHRASQASVSDASIASSDVFSLTDAISWPKPPRTPTASPDRH